MFILTSKGTGGEYSDWLIVSDFRFSFVMGCMESESEAKEWEPSDSDSNALIYNSDLTLVFTSFEGAYDCASDFVPGFHFV